MSWLQDKVARFLKPLRAGEAPQPTPAPVDWRARGNAALAAGDVGEAARCYQLAVDADPADPLARLNHGFALMEQSQFRAAAARMHEALALERPGDDHAPDAHYLLARAMLELGEFGKALSGFEAAARLKPGFLDPLDDAIRVLHRLGRHAEAATLSRERVARAGGQLVQLDADLKANPRAAGAALRRVSLLIEELRMEEAIAAARKSLRHLPDDVDLHWAHAMASLLAGDFATGWAEHEWRQVHPVHSRTIVKLAQPRWAGQSLEGRTLFLHSEQGFGDTLQFVRFLPLVARMARTVLVHVPPQVIALVTPLLPSNCVVVDEDAPLPAMDFQLPFMSLPFVLGTALDTIPAVAPYLRADPNKVQEWRERLGTGALRVGITWSGNPAHANDRNRSIPLDLFRSLDVDGCRFHALQPQVRPGDRDAMAHWVGLQDLGPELGDFADTGALVEALDLVITVDTSVAHLAGALGRPVWILLPYVPDWRWMLARGDSPWYPTARLYRQESPGDWSLPLARVRADLAALAAGHR